MQTFLRLRRQTPCSCSCHVSLMRASPPHHVLTPSLCAPVRSCLSPSPSSFLVRGFLAVASLAAADQDLGSHIAHLCAALADGSHFRQLLQRPAEGVVFLRDLAASLNLHAASVQMSANQAVSLAEQVLVPHSPPAEPSAASMNTCNNPQRQDNACSMSRVLLRCDWLMPAAHGIWSACFGWQALMHTL